MSNGTSSYDVQSTESKANYHQRIFTEELLAIIYCVVGGIGLVGNTFVIIVIFNYTAMRKNVTNIFITNQSLVDGLTSLVLILSVVFQDNGAILSGSSGYFICRVWYSKALLWGFFNVSTFNLLSVTLERYLAIVYPIQYKNYVSAKTANVVCLFIWLLGPSIELAISIPTAGLVHGRCNPLMFWPSLSFQRGVGICVIIIKYFIPLIIMCYCYTRIAIVLKSRVSKTASSSIHDQSTHQAGSIEVAISSSTNAPGKSDRMQKARQNVVRTLVLVTLCYFMCWTANQIYFLYFNLGNPIDFEGWIFHLTVIAVYCNCSCNPLIYIAQYNQFQLGIKRLKMSIMQRVFNETDISN